MGGWRNPSPQTYYWGSKVESVRKVSSCRGCGSKNLVEYINFGKVPLANGLLNSADSQVESYPIEVLVCTNCFLSQLSVVVDPSIMFSNYAYHSSVSKTFQKHCEDLVESASYHIPIDQNDLIVDIASNDGCLLSKFGERGFKNLLGVEPAENLIGDYKYDVINEFWSLEVAERIKEIFETGAKIITAQNVVAHVDNLHGFIDAVNQLLLDDGMFIFEVPHFLNLVKHNQIDTIYHEHLSYFTMAPLVSLLEAKGLRVFHVEEIGIHGGSIRVYCIKRNFFSKQSVNDLMHREYDAGLYDLDTYLMFGTYAKNVGLDLVDKLTEIKRDGKKVMGYGASAKGISLLNYFGVSNSFIHSIVDETEDKIGKFTPGSVIPIVGFDKFAEEKPDYILLLAWNFKEEMMEKTRDIGAKYIVPIPELEVI